MGIVYYVPRTMLDTMAAGEELTNEMAKITNTLKDHTDWVILRFRRKRNYGMIVSSASFCLWLFLLVLNFTLNGSNENTLSKPIMGSCCWSAHQQVFLDCHLHIFDFPLRDERWSEVPVPVS
jgi:hypothetical protein